MKRPRSGTGAKLAGMLAGFFRACGYMKYRRVVVLGLVVSWVILFSARAEAQQHRATRLGHPATRFAPPLVTPEDLRARFRDEKLKPDIAEILTGKRNSDIAIPGCGPLLLAEERRVAAALIAVE